MWCVAGLKLRTSLELLLSESRHSLPWECRSGEPHVVRLLDRNNAGDSGHAPRPHDKGKPGWRKILLEGIFMTSGVLKPCLQCKSQSGCGDLKCMLYSPAQLPSPRNIRGVPNVYAAERTGNCANIMVHCAKKIRMEEDQPIIHSTAQRTSSTSLFIK